MYFKQDQTSLTEEEYKTYLLELSAIVDGFPEFDNNNLIRLSAVCAEFSTTLDGDSKDIEDLRKTLKLASASFIYIMQITGSLLNAVKAVEELSGQKILEEDETKIIVNKPTEH